MTLCLAVTFAGANAATPQKSAPAPHLAPAFTLPGADGKTHALSDYRGRRLALFFFCGCEWCHKCALEWGKMQRSGALAAGGPMPLTLIAYHGDADEALSFEKETMLDPANTVLLLDPDEKVSATYAADPCPRVFVLDPAGAIRYTNNEMGADSYKIPAPLIAARAVNALRQIAAKAPVAKPHGQAKARASK